MNTSTSTAKTILTDTTSKFLGTLAYVQRYQSPQALKEFLKSDLSVVDNWNAYNWLMGDVQNGGRGVVTYFNLIRENGDNENQVRAWEKFSNIVRVIRAAVEFINSTSLQESGITCFSEMANIALKVSPTKTWITIGQKITRSIPDTQIAKGLVGYDTNPSALALALILSLDP